MIPTSATFEFYGKVLELKETGNLKVAYYPTNATSFEADYLIRNQKYYICEYIVADGNIAQVMLSDRSEQSISHAPACAREATYFFLKAI